MHIFIEIISLFLLLSGIMFLIRAFMYQQKKSNPCLLFILGLAMFILVNLFL